MEDKRNLPRLCLHFIVSFFVFCYMNKDGYAAACTAEEGKPRLLTCTNPNKDKNVGAEVLWKRSTTGNNTETVAICLKSGCDIIGNNDRFFNASLVNETSTLTIKNVSRFEPFNMTTNWTCKWGSEPPNTVCEPLHVIVQPEKPTCTANLRQDTVTVICTTQRVYPPAKCDFRGDGYFGYYFAELYDTTNESYSHTMLDNGRYYRSECQLTIKKNKRGPWERYGFEDSTSFFVRMYPGVSSWPSYSQHSQTWRIERVLRSDETTTTTTTTTQQPLAEAATMASSVEGDATEPGGYSLGTVISLAVLLFIMTAVAITLGILMYLGRRGQRQPKTLPPPSPPVTQPQPPQLPQPPQQNYDGMEMAQKDDADAEGHVYEGVNPRDTDAGFEEDGLADKSTYGNVKMSQSTKEDGQTDKSTYGNVKTSKKSNK